MNDFLTNLTIIGWTHEGTKRKMFRMDDDYKDVECFGILKSKFKTSRNQ